MVARAFCFLAGTLFVCTTAGGWAVRVPDCRSFTYSILPLADGGAVVSSICGPSSGITYRVDEYGQILWRDASEIAIELQASTAGSFYSLYYNRISRRTETGDRSWSLGVPVVKTNFSTMRADKEGGVLVAGRKDSDWTLDGKQLSLVYLTSVGDIAWLKQIDGVAKTGHHVRAVVSDGQQHFYVLVQSDESNGPSRAIVLRVSRAGNIEWRREIAMGNVSFLSAGSFGGADMIIDSSQAPVLLLGGPKENGYRIIRLFPSSGDATVDRVIPTADEVRPLRVKESASGDLYALLEHRSDSSTIARLDAKGSLLSETPAFNVRARDLLITAKEVLAAGGDKDYLPHLLRFHPETLALAKDTTLKPATWIAFREVSTVTFSARSALIAGLVTAQEDPIETCHGGIHGGHSWPCRRPRHFVATMEP
jgi:hypothetical protein